MRVFTPHASNIKGFALQRARPVWMRPWPICSRDRTMQKNDWDCFSIRWQATRVGQSKAAKLWCEQGLRHSGITRTKLLEAHTLTFVNAKSAILNFFVHLNLIQRGRRKDWKTRRMHKSERRKRKRNERTRFKSEEEEMERGRKRETTWERKKKAAKKQENEQKEHFSESCQLSGQQEFQFLWKAFRSFFQINPSPRNTTKTICSREHE